MLSNSFKVKSTRHHNKNTHQPLDGWIPGWLVEWSLVRSTNPFGGWLPVWLCSRTMAKFTLNCDQRFGYLVFKLKLDMLYNIFRWPFKLMPLLWPPSSPTHAQPWFWILCSCGVILNFVSIPYGVVAIVVFFWRKLSLCCVDSLTDSCRLLRGFLPCFYMELLLVTPTPPHRHLHCFCFFVILFAGLAFVLFPWLPIGDLLLCSGSLFV